MGKGLETQNLMSCRASLLGVEGSEASGRGKHKNEMSLQVGFYSHAFFPCVAPLLFSRKDGWCVFGAPEPEEALLLLLQDYQFLRDPPLHVSA